MPRMIPVLPPVIRIGAWICGEPHVTWEAVRTETDACHLRANAKSGQHFQKI